ncbi:MAG: hypothetical protein QOJ11_4368 [Frankiales bacterium]|jgi:hypothetical protein|nr:hypothetical protein [Frankiales bacterium]
MTWAAPAPLPVDGPLSGDDRPILEGYLAWERATLLNICAGLTAERLAMRSMPPSTLSLLGLVRHVAKVERIWLRQRAAGEAVEPMYDLSLAKDTDFDDGSAGSAEADFARLQAEWVLADAAVAVLPFDHTFVLGDDTWSLRMVYVHLIGEYSRHNGHADLLRQGIDGVTGR